MKYEPRFSPFFPLKKKDFRKLIRPLKEVDPTLWKVGSQIASQGVDILRPTILPTESQPNPKYDDIELINKATEHILKYIDRGALYGPIRKTVIPSDIFLSPIIVNWKKYPNKVRVIWNGSAPKNGVSVNSLIPDSVRSCKYPSFKELIQLAYSVGKGGYLWVADLEDAYWRIPVHPKFHRLLGAEWLGKVFIYACLPFGLATAPRIFTQFGDILIWILHFQNPSLWTDGNILLTKHYVDDFWGGSRNRQTAWKQYNSFLKLLKNLNIPTSPNKVQSPSYIVTILGFVINTMTRTVSLDPKKVKEYLQLIRNMIKYHKSVEFKQLESLIGKLRHTCKAVYGGPAFMRGLDDLLNQKRDVNGKFTIKKRSDAYIELLFWEKAIVKFNNIPFEYILRNHDYFHHTLYTDAATTRGFGGWDSLGNFFQQSNWNGISLPKLQHSKDTLINSMELITMISFIIANRHKYKNKNIFLWIDNATSKGWIISKKCDLNSPRFKIISNAIRSPMITCIKYKIWFYIEYISSERNKVADELSRGNKNCQSLIQMDEHNQPIDFKLENNITKSVKKIVNMLFKGEFVNL